MAVKTKARGRPIQTAEHKEGTDGSDPSFAGFQTRDKDLIRAIDRFAKAQRVRPSRTQVFIEAIRSFLEQEGFWPPPDQEGEEEA